MPTDPFEHRPDGYADETPAAVTAYTGGRIAADQPPQWREVFLPGTGWTAHTSIPVGRTLTNRTVRALKSHGVAAVEVVVAENRHACFTICELIR